MALQRPKLGQSLLLLGFTALCATSALAANQIMLSGNVQTKCVVDAQADAAATNLALAASGPQRVLIGAVSQDCNGTRSFTLEVFSTNCLAAPTGAKLLDPVSGESLSYSVESRNPTTGGSAPVVTNLLATQCSNQIARSVDHGLIRNESSTFYINYTGLPTLSAGTYEDVLTVTLTLQ